MTHETIEVSYVRRRGTEVLQEAMFRAVFNVDGSGTGDWDFTPGVGNITTDPGGLLQAVIEATTGQTGTATGRIVSADFVEEGDDDDAG